MENMSNLAFLKNIKKNLNNSYLIGLHNVIYSHHLKFKANEYYVKYFLKEFNFNIKEETSREKKAQNILNNGLFMTGGYMQNTISFIGINGEIKEQDFNYLYDNFGKHNFKEKNEKEDFVITIVVAIPNYIKVKSHDYFIGMTMKDEKYDEQARDLLTQIFFQDKLPKEFIYGYYKKKYNETGFNQLEDTLMFYENTNHFRFLNDTEQERVLLDNLNRNKIPFSLIEAVDNENLNFVDESEYETLNEIDVEEIKHIAFKNTIKEKKLKTRALKENMQTIS